MKYLLDGVVFINLGWDTMVGNIVLDSTLNTLQKKLEGLE